MSHLLETDACFRWFNQLQNQNILLTFKGHFNQQLINSIVFLIRSQSSISDEKIRIRRNVFHVMVECLQNISRHGSPRTDDSSMVPGIFLFGKTPEKYIIATGNLVRDEEVPALKNTLDHVIELSREALEEERQALLVSSELSEKGNAGLGLIEVARAASNIEYSFKQVAGGRRFLAMEVHI